MNLLDFMGMHPFLTFLLALILADCVVKSIAAARGHFGNDHCDNCRCDKTGESDEV